MKTREQCPARGLSVYVGILSLILRSSGGAKGQQGNMSQSSTNHIKASRTVIWAGILYLGFYFPKLEKIPQGADGGKGGWRGQVLGQDQGGWSMSWQSIDLHVTSWASVYLRGRGHIRGWWLAGVWRRGSLGTPGVCLQPRSTDWCLSLVQSGAGRRWESCFWWDPVNNGNKGAWAPWLRDPVTHLTGPTGFCKPPAIMAKCPEALLSWGLQEEAWSQVGMKAKGQGRPHGCPGEQSSWRINCSVGIQQMLDTVHVTWGGHSRVQWADLLGSLCFHLFPQIDEVRLLDHIRTNKGPGRPWHPSLHAPLPAHTQTAHAYCWSVAWRHAERWSPCIGFPGLVKQTGCGCQVLQTTSSIPGRKQNL